MNEMAKIAPRAHTTIKDWETNQQALVPRLSI